MRRMGTIIVTWEDLLWRRSYLEHYEQVRRVVTLDMLTRTSESRRLGATSEISRLEWGNPSSPGHGLIHRGPYYSIEGNYPTKHEES